MINKYKKYKSKNEINKNIFNYDYLQISNKSECY
jgi:hypothetical protein